MGSMTALEVYEAFYDSANDSDKLIADFNGNEVEAIKAYADGAFDIVLTDDSKIINNKINLINKNVYEGFIFNDYVVLGRNDLFNFKIK